MALVLFASCTLLVSCGRNGAARWNVLLVTLDTTRADAIGCYGAAAKNTPHLDRLAAEGTRFDLAISTSAFTPISHASILTGLDNRHHDLRVIAGVGLDLLSNTVPTLATILRENGYRTSAATSAFTASSRYGFARGFEVFDAPGGFEVDPRNWDFEHLQRRADDTTARVLAGLTATKEPFFVWAHFFDPHDAFLMPPPEHLPEPLPRTSSGLLYMSDELYRAEVGYLDHQIGRILDELRRTGAYDRTIVVVVADHGEGRGDHGWPYHGIVYQEQIRVPLLIRVPEGESGGVVDRLSRTIDVAPTILDHLGLLEGRQFDGASLRPLMEGQDDPPRIAVADAVNGYDENCDIPFRRPLDDFLYCATDGRWKLIYRPAHAEQSELFDLVADPREAKNVFSPDAEPTIRMLRELAVRAGFVVDRSRARLDPWTTAALESLGYVGATHPAEPIWSWRCPVHRSVVSRRPGPCRICDEPTVPFVQPRT